MGKSKKGPVPLAYLTRDKDGALTLWGIKPTKDEKDEIWNADGKTYQDVIELTVPKKVAPQVKWKDEEPTPVYGFIINLPDDRP